ncbi:MAG: hypothetical protein LBP81_05815 [Treponema sp.]|jgi:hypothetical protein|nr:hypothetical protein [Treponema sp.]
MKKVKGPGVLFGLLILLGGTSCGSAPPPVEEIPAPEPVVVQPALPAPPAQDPNLGPPDQAALDSLAAAKKQAEEARKRASDFGGAEYASGEWEAAEAQYAGAGRQEKTDTLGNVKEAAAGYEQAAAAFDDVFNRALPQYAKALEDQIFQARAAALEAGIITLSPERLQSADNTVDKALGLYEAQDYYAASGAGYLALDMFRLLKTGAETYTVWQEIGDYGFEKYDPGTYGAANTAALAVINGYDALSYAAGGDLAELLRQAEEVQAGYNTVLGTGWKLYAAERRASAGAERQAALALKANVAVRDEYGAAQTLYDRAGTSFQKEVYPEAAELYFRSEFLFAAASGTAAEKRRAAGEALQKAEAKASDSDETARKAAVILEGDNE